jgi:TonB family protein
LALGLMGTWLARRSRAAVRHALLASAFGVLLVLPIASIVAPSVRIAVPGAAQDRIVSPLLAGAREAIPPVAPARPIVGVTTVVPRSAGLSLSGLLLTGWIAGTALFLVPVVTGLWEVRWLRRSALPWPHGQSVVERLALDAGIHRRVEVLLQGALPGPMTCGVVHPAIVLSPDAQTWEEEDLQRAIVHELEHIRRGDWVSQCLARVVCAVYWFQPLVWIAWRKFALEAERSCDDAVLGRSDATAYADQLVGLARRLSVAPKSPLLAMANRADLATRVGAVLDSQQRRGRAGALPVALAWAAAAVLVLTISPLRIAAAPQSASTDVGVKPQFSANGMLVMVRVTVSDKNGKTIEGLGASDFAVTEDGVAQAIRIFEFQKPAPISQGTPGAISSYYTLGYYTTNRNLDGKFRKVEIAGKQDTMAKLEYRAGYYCGPPNGSASGGIGPGGVDRSTGLDITLPVLVDKKEPEYSEKARKAQYQGTVTLYVDVNASGQVTNIKVNRSLGLGLDEKATEAVSQWKFKPGMQAGKPVTMQAQVAVNFRLL